MDNQIKEIPLEQIRPAPWNPASRLDPAKVKGMADSIKREGQKSAALIRPVEAEAPVKYELVFGHRRYAARTLLAIKDPAQGVLRSEIEEMTEERAMILSGIENLQRANFTDYEEAEFIQTCSARYGESAVKLLSEKLSVAPRYIRKRIEILKLPEVALELWRSGAWHVGHMEQLLRLGEDVVEFLEQAPEWCNDLADVEVGRLRNMIERQDVNLKLAAFDKTECKGCPKNSDCQRKLFDTDLERGVCIDVNCFQAKQQAWLDVNWRNCKENTFRTLAAIIGDYNTPTTGKFGWDVKAAEKCFSCEKFTTVLHIRNGIKGVNDTHTCMGEASCFAEIKKEAAALKRRMAGEKEVLAEDMPRVAWHGEFYRQEFYQDEVPQLMNGLEDGDPRRVRLALAVMVYDHRDLHAWFYQYLGYTLPEKENDYDYFRLTFSHVLELAKDAIAPLRLLGLATVQVMLTKNGGFTDEHRQVLAEFMDIDFTNFQVTPEYLKKKTKAEILKFIGTESGLLQDVEFIAYLQSKGMSTGLEKLAMYKKGALVDLVLNCGVDLHGRLPKEIADRPEGA